MSSEERRKEEEGGRRKEEEEATDIKSNNPHLAGGEQQIRKICMFSSPSQNLAAGLHCIGMMTLDPLFL